MTALTKGENHIELANNDSFEFKYTISQEF